MNRPQPNEQTLPPDVMADTQALLEHLTSGKPLDPEIYRRIRDRGERVTEEIRRTHGVVNIAVDLIREARDAE